MEITVTDSDFETKVINCAIPVVVDFWAPWCGPCQIMGPVIEELAKEMDGKAKVGKCNVDENGDTASKFGIMSIPSIKIFKGGKIVKDFVGVQAKIVLEKALEELK